jgi:hypothetical protein
VGRLLVVQPLPGADVAEAAALWFDLSRRASFVEGFAHAAKVEGGWPGPGGRLVWDTRPGSLGRRGRVIEVVLEHEAGVRQIAEVEDERVRGTQTVELAPAPGGARIALELRYALKDPGPIGALRDLALVRRPLGDALRVTLRRFARELAAERELR